MISVQKKKIIAVTLALLAISPVALAGFNIIHDGDEPKPLSPIGVVTETHEKERLQAELNRMSKELTETKARLAYALSDLEQSQQALQAANARLDLMQSKVEQLVVSFAFGDTEFVPQSDAAEKITAYAKAAGTVRVRGYTDSVGSVAANKQVALQRAMAVKRYLVGQGVKESIIKASGRTGEYVASNETEAGRQANRRVEIDFIP